MVARQTILALMLSGTFLACAPRAESADESAVVRTADDAGLQWGPCPAFLHRDAESPCSTEILESRTPTTTEGAGQGKVADALAFIGGTHGADRGRAARHVEGQKTAVMTPGSYAYGPAKLGHSGVCASEVPCVLFIAFESPVDAVASEREEK